MRELNSIQQLLVILFLVTCITTSFFSLVLMIEKPNDFKINYETFLLPTIYLITSFLASFVLYWMWKSSEVYKFDESDKNNFILKFKYNKNDWLEFKKKEYYPKILKHYLILLTVYIPILIVILFIKEEDESFALIITHVLVIFSIPILLIIERKFIKELINNLSSKGYIVYIYKKGIKINNWYFPYNHYINSQNNITLHDIKVIEKDKNKYLQFESKQKMYLNASGPDDNSSRKKTKWNILKVPITNYINIDLKKLRTDLH